MDIHKNGRDLAFFLASRKSIQPPVAASVASRSRWRAALDC